MKLEKRESEKGNNAIYKFIKMKKQGKVDSCNGGRRSKGSAEVYIKVETEVAKKKDNLSKEKKKFTEKKIENIAWEEK